jgi:hypothetical protein
MLDKVIVAVPPVLRNKDFVAQFKVSFPAAENV